MQSVSIDRGARRAATRARTTAVVAAMVLLAAPVALAQDTIKIGWISELTGPYAFTGSSCRAGMEIAVEEINNAGGALGKKFEYIVQDNQTNAAQSAAAARALDTQQNVLALSGPTSSDTGLAVYGYAEQNKVPFVVPVAAFPQLTKPGTHWTFRVEPDAAGWGYALVKFLESRKPNATVALFYSDLALTRAISAGFKYQAERSKVSVVSEVIFPQGSSDATVQAAQVRAKNPDYVVVMSVGGFEATMTNQLLDVGFKPDQLIHPYGFTALILGWGPRSNGSYFGTFFDKGVDALTPLARTFLTKFQERNKRAASYIENFCYITPYLIKEAVDKAGAVDRTKFRNAVSAINTKEVTTGVPIKFDKNGARVEYYYVMQLLSMEGKDYQSKQVFYTEWNADVIPVYDLVK